MATVIPPMLLLILFLVTGGFCFLSSANTHVRLSQLKRSQSKHVMPFHPDVILTPDLDAILQSDFRRMGCEAGCHSFSRRARTSSRKPRKDDDAKLSALSESQLDDPFSKNVFLDLEGLFASESYGGRDLGTRVEDSRRQKATDVHALNSQVTKWWTPRSVDDVLRVKDKTYWDGDVLQAENLGLIPLGSNDRTPGQQDVTGNAEQHDVTGNAEQQDVTGNAEQQDATGNAENFPYHDDSSLSREDYVIILPETTFSVDGKNIMSGLENKNVIGEGGSQEIRDFVDIVNIPEDAYYPLEDRQRIGSDENLGLIDTEPRAHTHESGDAEEKIPNDVISDETDFLEAPNTADTMLNRRSLEKPAVKMATKYLMDFIEHRDDIEYVPKISLAKFDSSLEESQENLLSGTHSSPRRPVFVRQGSENFDKMKEIDYTESSLRASHQDDQATDIFQPTGEGDTTDALVSKRWGRKPRHKNLFLYGQDDRRPVFLQQMRKFPFSNIVRLSTGCTGTLVTPRHVLTAAHCVHNGLGFRDNVEKLKMEIPDTMGFKDYYAQKIIIPPGWLRQNYSRDSYHSLFNYEDYQRAVYDYAVVRLKLAVAGRNRFLPLAVPRPEVLKMNFHFLGFPDDESKMWRSVCVDSLALGDGNLIMTRCDAAVGNSGAAVFIQDPPGGMRVVGVLSNTIMSSATPHYIPSQWFSVITTLTWPKLTDICRELGDTGRKYGVCPPLQHMRRSLSPPLPLPFFGKRAAARAVETNATSRSATASPVSRPASVQAHPAWVQTYPARVQTHPAAEQMHPAAEQMHPAAVTERGHVTSEVAVADPLAPSLVFSAAEGRAPVLSTFAESDYRQSFAEVQKSNVFASSLSDYPQAFLAQSKPFSAGAVSLSKTTRARNLKRLALWLSGIRSATNGRGLSRAVPQKMLFLDGAGRDLTRTVDSEKYVDAIS